MRSFVSDRKPRRRHSDYTHFGHRTQTQRRSTVPCIQFVESSSYSTFQLHRVGRFATTHSVDQFGCGHKRRGATIRGEHCPYNERSNYECNNIGCNSTDIQANRRRTCVLDTGTGRLYCIGRRKRLSDRHLWWLSKTNN